MMPSARFAALVGLMGLILVGAPPLAGAREVPGDAFLCAAARAPRARRGEPAPPVFHPRVAVSVVDRYTRPVASELYTLDLRKPEAFCRPVRLDDADPTAPLSGLELYAARRTRRRPAPPPLPPTTEVVDGALGTIRLKIRSVQGLAVPTLATGSIGGGIAAERSHYACYAVRHERAPGERRGALRVPVRTAEGPRTLELRKPVALCVPASVRGADPAAPKEPVDLLCWDARVPSSAFAPTAEVLATRNGFGNELLKIGALRRLCVPAARLDVDVPTPTPFPTFTPPPTPVPTVTPVPTPEPPAIRIEPASTRGLLRDRQCLAAVMTLPGGATRDVTKTALWRVADGTIAVPAGTLDGRRCFVGVGIGATTVTARDPETGVVSAPARVEAEWPIFQLTVHPKQFGLRLGDSETLTATAWFAGGVTRNVTQHVRYESADPAVAGVPNAPGNRSRVDGTGKGRTTVSILDPFSSLSDAASVAVGALARVVVEGGDSLFPGETARLKAVGVFSEGFQGNLTGQVTWESSDPDVVVASNDPGDGGRILAVSPGTAVIDATDPQSGLRSTCCGTVAVLGDALQLFVAPARVDRRLHVDVAPVLLSAHGIYAVPPGGSASRVVGGRVAWTSSELAVAAIGDVHGDQPELVLVGAGEALVVATDPSNGLASSPIAITVYDRLDRVEVGTSKTDPAENEARQVVVGQGSAYVVHGYFDGGRHRLLAEADLVVSDPTIARVTSNRYVTGLRPGTVTISAVDGPTGRSSADGGRDAVLEILGDLVRIALSPRTVALDPGQSTSLTAIGHHGGGGTENVTQRVTWASSDPSVVVAENAAGNRSRITAVAAGSAVISAFDPESGVGSGDTADDVVVTVRDVIVAVAVTPATRLLAVGAVTRLTATGTYGQGATANLTQLVEWSSSAPAVAVAPNLPGDRSRIEAVGPGTAVITARDPETGVASSDGGGDATVTVGALAAITLAPSAITLRVGELFSLTTLGTLEGGAGTVNLTQDAVYASSDPAVVVATNLAGNRSRVQAVAPGVATVTASRSSTYPQATESNAVTVTVVAAE